MSYEQKEGTGVLFVNEKKKDTHPDLKGKVKINGKDYEIAAWVKDGAKGKFYSLKVNEPMQKTNKPVEDLPF